MQRATLAPNDSFTQFSAFDPQALILALQEGFLEHVQLQKGLFGGQIAHSFSCQCRTDWGQYNLALLAQGDLSPDRLTVGIFLHGDGAWHVQGRHMSNGDVVLYAAGSEMCVSLPPRAQWLSVQIPRQRLESLGFRMLPGTRTLHLPGRLAPDSARTLKDLAAVLGPQRVQAPCSAQSELAHEQLLQVVWTELSRRWHQPRERTLSSQAARQRLVQAAHQWCRDRSETPLRMDALCEDMEVPIWQLERVFHETYGLPPQRLLTLHRLSKARHDLLSLSTGVTEVATGHGFWHLGRFAQLYKEYFGESPSDTLRRTRR